jgi:hypothetical protein
MICSTISSRELLLFDDADDDDGSCIIVGAIDDSNATLGANDTDVLLLLDASTSNNLLANDRNWLGVECTNRKLNSTGVWI